MRAIHVIALCGFLVVVGLISAFGRRFVSPVAPAPAQSTFAALPPSPLPPDLAPLPTFGQAGASATSAISATPATAGLACIQNALGGVNVLAGVTSLRIVGNTKPTATTGFRPVANKREIGVVFPDRYKRSSVQTDASPGQAPLTGLSGFNGNELLSGLMTPRPPDDAVPKLMHGIRLAFVRDMLTRLPRELADESLSQRTSQDSGQARLAIDASGPDGLDATLLADARTCMPVALQYSAGSDTYRVELSDYRRFGGILFPTVLKTAKNGEAWEEEHDSEIQVNARFGDAYFRKSRG